jgi:hypothetical protein
MKRLYSLIILLALVAPQGLWAQNSIKSTLSEAVSKYEKSNIKEDHRTKKNPDGSSASTDVYTFTDVQKSDVDDFIDSFDKDSQDAYFYEKGNRSDRQVLLGENIIGRDYDWHNVLCFNDSEHEGYRYGYALEWNDSGNDFRVTIEYGERPARDLSMFKDSFDSFMDGFGSLGDTVFNALGDIDWNAFGKYMDDAMSSVDWRQLSDSVAKSMRIAGDSVYDAIKGIDWGEIGDSVSRALNSVDWSGISDSVAREIRGEADQFRRELDRSRESERDSRGSGFLKPLREKSWSEKFDDLMDTASPNSTEDISKIYDLCKNHPANLSKEDRESYTDSLKDLRKRSDDRVLRKMLSASIKFLKS